MFINITMIFAQYVIKDKGFILDVKLSGKIDSLMKKLVLSINEMYGNTIYPEQHYHFSKIRVGNVDANTNFLRLYGIGIDNMNTEFNWENESINIVWESLLNECIGYIESPIEKNVLNKYRILEEYASEILKSYDIISDSELINELAAATYEGEECAGNIVFISDTKNDTKANADIEFEEIELSLENLRIIRKYLEMSRAGYGLLVRKEGKKYFIYGLDKMDNLRERNIKCSILRFTGYRKWRIEIAGSVMLERKNEKYYIPDIEKIDLKIKEALEELTLENIEKMEKIVKYAREQQHGTMIIFTNRKDAEKLTEYFCNKNRGIKIKESSNDLFENPEMILNLSAIDGAVIIDTDGRCHAIGVILDGIADKECNMARGARYNSALTFISNEGFEKRYDVKSEDCKIFVFSEDKTINIFPNDCNNRSYN